MVSTPRSFSPQSLALVRADDGNSSNQLPRVSGARATPATNYTTNNPIGNKCPPNFARPT